MRSRVQVSPLRPMKKIVTVFILLAFFFLFVFIIRKKPIDNKKTILYQLNGKNYRLLTARNPQEWKRGLMNYHVERDSGLKLDGADGMMFLFPDKKVRSFWNKNTFMDLRLYWLDNNVIIGESFLPSIEKSKEIITVISPKEVNKVIELPL